MDIVEVASYPKSGSTWLCNIITQYCHQQYSIELVVNNSRYKTKKMVMFLPSEKLL